MQKVTAKGVRYTDYKGDQKYYLQLANENGEQFYITVGKGTIEKIEELENAGIQAKIEFKDTEKPLKDGNKG